MAGAEQGMEEKKKKEKVMAPVGAPPSVVEEPDVNRLGRIGCNLAVNWIQRKNPRPQKDTLVCLYTDEEWENIKLMRTKNRAAEKLRLQVSGRREERSGEGEESAVRGKKKKKRTDEPPLAVQCKFCMKILSWGNKSWSSFGSHLPSHYIFDDDDVARAESWLGYCWSEYQGGDSKHTVEVVRGEGVEGRDMPRSMLEKEFLVFDDTMWVQGQIYRGKYRDTKVVTDNQSSMEKSPPSYPRGGMEYKMKVKAITKCIIGDCLHLSLVESDLFRAMVKELDPRMGAICSKNVLGTGYRMWKEMKEKIVKNKILFISSFTMDFWTSRGGKQMMGITAHYVWNLKLRSAALACREVNVARLDHEEVACQLKEVMEEYGGPPPFPSFVTDAGGNVSMAVNNDLHWNWFRCAAHLVHNVVMVGLMKLMGKKKKKANKEKKNWESDAGDKEHDDGEEVQDEDEDVQVNCEEDDLLEDIVDEHMFNGDESLPEGV